MARNEMFVTVYRLEVEATREKQRDERNKSIKCESFMACCRLNRKS